MLSGWLLTRQVLRMRASFKSSIALTVRFWTRRWARILPPYWLVLLFLFVFGKALIVQGDPTLSVMSFPELLKHFLFLQTLMPPNAYLLSWSLVTEEWFYLLLPLVVILLAFRVHDWRVLMPLGVAAILVPTLIRAVLLTTPMAWRMGILSLPQARFEGLAVGALLAAASLGTPWWDTQVIRRRGMLFGMGLAAISIVLVAGAFDTWTYRVFGILAFNVGLGLLLPFLSHLRWPVGAPVAGVIGIAYLSELTYPLYLLHVFRVHLGSARGVMVIVSALLSMATLFVAASMLHLAVERPFLAVRDRYDTERARRAGAAVPAAAEAAAWKEPAVSGTEQPELKPGPITTDTAPDAATPGPAFSPGPAG